MKRRFDCGCKMLLVAVPALLLSACDNKLKVGDMEDVGKASNLAVACKTAEALSLAGDAKKDGGLAASMSGLVRIAILRDAGRTAEADAELALISKRINESPQDAAKTNASIDKTVENFRAERLKVAGRATCP